MLRPAYVPISGAESALQNMSTGDSFELPRQSRRRYSSLIGEPTQQEARLNTKEILVLQKLTTEFNNGIDGSFLLVHYCESSAKRDTKRPMGVTKRPTRGSLLELIELSTDLTTSTSSHRLKILVSTHPPQRPSTATSNQYPGLVITSKSGSQISVCVMTNRGYIQH